MSLYSVAGRLAAPRFEDLDRQRLLAPLAFTPEGVRKLQDKILDEVLDEAYRAGWAITTGDRSDAPDLVAESREPEIRIENLTTSKVYGDTRVRVRVTWDPEDDPPFGMSRPGSLQWVPWDVYQEEMEYAGAVADWLSDRFRFAVSDWEDA